MVSLRLVKLEEFRAAQRSRFSGVGYYYLLLLTTTTTTEYGVLLLRLLLLLR